MSDQVLSHERVGSEDAGRWLYILHGIYGAGRNWLSIARRVVREREDWGVILVDLRQHGGSHGFPPPHTIEAAADDVTTLADRSESPMRALLGHSFGGKVAMACARAGVPGLRQIWVVDSTPAASEPGGSAWNMLKIVRALPDRFATREDLISALERDGVERPVAQWMATNLQHRDGAYSWRFDLDALEELLRDFYRTDLMDLVESPPDDLDVRFVRATRASVLRDEPLRRVEAAAAAGRIRLDSVEGGHWLNADNPDAIVSLLSESLPA